MSNFPQMRDTKIILYVGTSDTQTSSRNKLHVYKCPLCKEERLATMSNINSVGHSYCKGCAKISDISGIKFGRLKALSFSHKTKTNLSKNRIFWNFQCDCGNIKCIDVAGVKLETVVSCGCYHTEIINSFKGKDHPSYRHDISDNDRENSKRSASNPQYIIWRTAVYDRDSYKCQCCNNTGLVLNCHHISPWSKYPDLRFDIDNGITLCKSCHVKYHSYCGYNNVNKETLSSFLLISTFS